MSHADKNKQAIDDFFSSYSFKDEAAAIDFFEELKPQERARRYVREDVAVSMGNFFHLVFRKTHPIKLININSLGALIASKLKFEPQQNITLIFKFNSGKQFKIKGMVVNKRESHSELHYYGVKFDHDHDGLNHYLLSTKMCTSHKIPNV